MSGYLPSVGERCRIGCSVDSRGHWSIALVWERSSEHMTIDEARSFADVVVMVCEDAGALVVADMLRTMADRCERLNARTRVVS